MIDIDKIKLLLSCNIRDYLKCGYFNTSLHLKNEEERGKHENDNQKL